MCGCNPRQHRCLLWVLELLPSSAHNTYVISNVATSRCSSFKVSTNNAESEILIIFLHFLGASAPKNCAKKAVIQSAASAASAKGGCASS